jgi:hypothetical protein
MISPLYKSVYELVKMFIQADIAVKQTTGAVYALLGVLALYRHNIAVPVGLYTSICKAPFQYRIIVIVYLLGL